MTDEEKDAVEKIVNKKIEEGLPVGLLKCPRKKRKK